MSSFAPFDDLRTRILAANLLPARNIAFPNELFISPQPPAIWIAVEITSDVLDPADLGANVWQESGTGYFHILAPTGSGTDDARKLAKDVANVFRDLPTGNPFYRGASIGLGQTSDPEGTYWQLTVSVDFVYFDKNT